jgi:hypothetical protein
MRITRAAIKLAKTITPQIMATIAKKDVIGEPVRGRISAPAIAIVEAPKTCPAELALLLNAMGLEGINNNS